MDTDKKEKMSNIKTAKLKKLEHMVADWNEKYPAGTRILVRLDDGSQLKSSTRSEAWIMAGNTPVVQVLGITGNFQLHRITPMAARKQ